MQRIVTIIMLMCIISHTWCVYAQPQPANTDHVNRKWKDMSYASLSPSQKLDIYLPNEGNGPFPVILSIHGGAFMMGDKADGQLNPMLEGLKRGYAVVSINYRMSGEALFPANIQDVKAAIRWIRAHAKEYLLNGDRIAAWGGSAGGNLSALAGTSGDVKELEGNRQGDTSKSSRVQAVVDWFGPIEFIQMDEQFKVSGKGKADHSEPNSPESRVLGKQITLIPEKVRAASPATYITKDDPPFFIQHGEMDPLVPVEQSVNLHKSLLKVLPSDKVSFEILSGAGHGGPQFEMKENLDKVFAFLDKWLKR
jgi:acetyl esterase/lipase